MEEFKKETRKQVKLEDLLKLKRAEKPDESFWDSFEKELHQKAIKAVVCKPRLRVRILNAIYEIPTQFAQLKHAIPVSALALLTIGLFCYQRPTMYDAASSFQVAVSDNASLGNTDLLLSSVRTNFVKRNINTELQGIHHYTKNTVSPVAPRGNEIRYLAGNVSSTSLAATGYSNTLF